MLKQFAKIQTQAAELQKAGSCLKGTAKGLGFTVTKKSKPLLLPWKLSVK
jgi:hypothetical protein